MFVGMVPMSEDDLLEQTVNGSTGSSDTAADAAKGFISRPYPNSSTYRNPFQDFWHDITGQSNTDATNSATFAMQKQAQGFNAQEAAKQRGFEAEQAQIARQWQEEMSNTAVQRQTADLKAAGLNPWLAAGGSGASTGSVGIAMGDSASSAQGQAINATKSGAEILAAVGITAATIYKILKLGVLKK